MEDEILMKSHYYANHNNQTSTHELHLLIMKCIQLKNLDNAIAGIGIILRCPIGRTTTKAAQRLNNSLTAGFKMKMICYV